MSCKLVFVAAIFILSVAITTSLPLEHYLTKRAILLDENFAPTDFDREGADDGQEVMEVLPSGNLVRAKRGHHHHHLPTWMNTYAMTDHHGHFKWGVRHNIKHH